MSSETAEIEGMIARLEAKRDALTQAINSLRESIGIAGDSPVPPGGSGGGGSADIHSGTFYGKTIPEATKQYLGMCNKRPQAITTIVEALKRGGVETKAANFSSMVLTILRRVDNQTGEIMRMPDGNWALPEWFGKRPVPKNVRKGKEGASSEEEAEAAAG